MLPLPNGAGKSEEDNRVAGRPHLIDNQAIPKANIRPKKFIDLISTAVAIGGPKNNRIQVLYAPEDQKCHGAAPMDGLTMVRGKEGSSLSTSYPIDRHGILSDVIQLQRARTLPGSAHSRRVSVDLLIRHFESLDQDDEHPRLEGRQRAVTNPAPDLRSRYHSALHQRRGPEDRHPSAAAILEDGIAEDRLSRARLSENTDLSPEKLSSLTMWPFTDRKGNLKIEPLAPAESMASNTDQQDMRRKSTTEVDQQEEPLTSLRPSKSLSSMRLVPQRRGLCVPPGTTVSESSEVFAQGKVSSQPRQAENHDQPTSKQPQKGAGQDRYAQQGSKRADHIVNEENLEGAAPDHDAQSDNDKGRHVVNEENPEGAAPDHDARSENDKRDDVVSEENLQGAASDHDVTQGNKRGDHIINEENLDGAESENDAKQGTKRGDHVVNEENLEQTASDHHTQSDSDKRDHVVDKENLGGATMDPKEYKGSIDDDQEAKPHVKPAEREAMPTSQTDDTSVSMPFNATQGSRERVPSPVADDEQQPLPNIALNSDSEAPVQDLPSAKAALAAWLHPWLVTSARKMDTPDGHQPRRGSSVQSPIPTIRVQQTTESEEIAPTLANATAANPETRPVAAKGPIPEDPEDESCRPALALTNCPRQLDAEISDQARHLQPSSIAVPKVAGVDEASLMTPSVETTRNTIDAGHPGFAKLAVRKARNLAGSRLVLSMFLGRQLAEQTKPQLVELARPPIWGPGRTVPVSGPSQVDGIAELEESWSA